VDQGKYFFAAKIIEKANLVKVNVNITSIRSEIMILKSMDSP